MKDTFPFGRCPDWFPDFVREMASLSPAEFRYLDAMLAQKIARAAQAHEEKQKRPRKPPTLAGSLKQARKAGVSVSAAVLGSGEMPRNADVMALVDALERHRSAASSRGAYLPVLPPRPHCNPAPWR